MRPAAAAGIATTVAWALGFAPPAPGAPAGVARSRSCVPPQAHVLARNSSVGIYQPRPRGPAEPRATLACLAGHSGHMTLLAATRLNQHSSLGRFELAGHVAAYLETQFGVDSGTRKLVVVDVGARRVLHSIQAGSYADAGLIFSEDVARFLVTARGSVAWTATRSEHREPAGGSVYAAPRTGPPALLDSGPAIDAGSLALSGAMLSWTDGGAQRTAPMP